MPAAPTSCRNEHNFSITHRAFPPHPPERRIDGQRRSDRCIRSTPARHTWPFRPPAAPPVGARSPRPFRPRPQRPTVSGSRGLCQPHANSLRHSRQQPPSSPPTASVIPANAGIQPRGHTTPRPHLVRGRQAWIFAPVIPANSVRHSRGSGNPATRAHPLPPVPTSCGAGKPARSPHPGRGLPLDTTTNCAAWSADRGSSPIRSCLPAHRATPHSRYTAGSPPARRR
jgi:hypothetical protein